MITIREFKRARKHPKEKLTDAHVSLFPKEIEMLEKFCKKHDLSKSSAAGYFCVLGMQAHRKRSGMKRKYGRDAELQMLREEIIAEFERRLELEA